jgi:redox-sensitive bicupin YhaK (pirin superfamily)
MIVVRPSDERGRMRLDWLDARFSFSFADYYDPRWMGFGPLRVINEDRISPGGGFPLHPHRDMEIVTWVMAGAIQHADTMGHSGVVTAGEAQRITAGRGMYHSEFNAARGDNASAAGTEVLHLLQIWFLPAARSLEPSYGQQTFPAAEREGRLQLVASRDARDGAMSIATDVDFFAGRIGPDGGEIVHRPRPDGGQWLQLTHGTIAVNGVTLSAGDGVAFQQEGDLRITGTPGADFVLFDMR